MAPHHAVKRIFHLRVEGGKNVEIDLDLVLITPEVLRAWRDEVAPQAARLLIAAGYSGPIPDERGRVEADGSLTIFVTLAGHGEVGMSVPHDHWTWVKSKPNH